MISKAAFSVEFRTDIVLSASGAAEGQHESQDFIPGSNFLGIAAAELYNQSGFPSYDMFHAGCVRFGNAYPYVAAKGQTPEPALPCPAVWLKPKPGTAKKGFVDEGTVLVHHRVTHERHERMAQSGVQLKSVRSGYFLPVSGGMLKPLVKHYSLKSAYDSDNRRAKDGAFFGYEALPSGSRWYFEIEADAGMDHAFEMVCKAIEGTKRLGRSRSAQYGQVRISRLDKPAGATPSKDNGNIWALYAASRLCLFDANGRLTTAPDAQTLGLPEGSAIRYDLSQIRTFQYSPWNGALRRRDAARVGIERGSVFIGEVPEGSEPAKWRDKANSGIGAYRAEGFGRILLNPAFLDAGNDGATTLSLHEIEHLVGRSAMEQSALDQPDKELINWVSRQQQTKANRSGIYKRAYAFATNNQGIFKGISASQWGAIRAIAVKAKDNDDVIKQLFKPNTIQPNAQGTPGVLETGGFLMHGKSHKDWRGRPLDTLKEALEKEKELKLEEGVRPFLIQVCSEMAKRQREKK